MKQIVWGACLLFAALSAQAEERDPMEVCDERNDACVAKCDGMENASSSCYDTCDTAYRRCLDIANGYTPELPGAYAADANASAKKAQK
ncbi:hypothetical protein LOH54_05995 [Sulfurimonas sp. HSL-3221]|uniref:hypothetical protein n=1 Tax=Sulfurimonadaceae TaxID=2771471 RepID=UPI001E4D7C09|nr:hypothetical protein [Sulfurimonas sp. HSL-3221]UFS63682.1 hypothetical protein LOH54_05995 [Sulfurimonas sp. HSL-3221]